MAAVADCAIRAVPACCAATRDAMHCCHVNAAPSMATSSSSAVLPTAPFMVIVFMRPRDCRWSVSHAVWTRPY